MIINYEVINKTTKHKIMRYKESQNVFVCENNDDS